jgi:exopolysaccharide production protein ExoQ
MPPPARAAMSPSSPLPRRRASMTVREVAGGGALAVLFALFWWICYQNLPTEINGLVIKPFSTAGSIDRTNKLATIFISAGIIASRWSLAQHVIRANNPGLLAFMVLAPLSAAWSIDANATILRYITLIGIFLLCFAISVSGWNQQRLRQVIVPPAMAILVVSLIVGALHPDKVIHVGQDLSQKDAWHGITFHKNIFGMTASLITILGVHRWLVRGGKGKAWTLVGIGIAATCMLLSRSSTSLFATIVAVGVMVLLMRVTVIRQRYSTHVVVAVSGMIVLYQLVIQDVIPGVNVLLAPIMGLTGKDTTFSARSIIWDVVKEHSRASPLLGSGYGAYWQAEPTPASPSYVFMYLMNFYPSESHNGYLEIMNDLGLVGLLCLLAFLVYYMKQALQLMQFDRNSAVMYLALLFQQMIANMSESEWFSRSTVCSMLILACTCLSRELYEHKQLAAASLRARPPGRQPLAASVGAG